jgi:PAS domain-containing protein
MDPLSGSAVIITVDTDLRVIEANQAAQTICGLDTKQIIGNVFTEVSSRCNNAFSTHIKKLGDEGLGEFMGTTGPEMSGNWSIPLNTLQKNCSASSCATTEIVSVFVLIS